MNAEERVRKVRDVVKNWNDFIKEAEAHTNYSAGVLSMMKAARNDINKALGDER